MNRSTRFLAIGALLLLVGFALVLLHVPWMPLPLAFAACGGALLAVGVTKRMNE